MGCVLCAALLHRLGEECGPRGRRAEHRNSTKLARFEVRKLFCMQASSFEQHSRTECHVKASDAFLRPAQPLGRSRAVALRWRMRWS